MSSSSVGYGVWSMFLLLLVFGGNIGGCVLMSQRRTTTSAFRIRHPYLTMLFTLSLALFLAVKNFVNKVYPSSSFLLWDVIASLFLAGFCPFLYFLRTWKILFDSETLAARSRRAMVVHSWFLSHQSIGSEEFLFWAVLVAFGVHAIAGVIVAASIGAILNTTNDGITFSTRGAAIAAFLILMVLVIVSFVMGIRVGVAVPQSETYFWLRIEILSTLLTVIVFSCIWIAMIVKGRADDAMVFLNVATALVLTINVVITVLGSAREGKQARMFNATIRKSVTKKPSASPATEQDLERLRQKYPQGMGIQVLFEEVELLEKFRIYLEQELATENLLFYEDVERFKHICKDSPEARVKEKAKNLFDKYLAKNAPYQINLDADTVRDLRTMYFSGNVTPTMFDEAQKEILDLMEKDTFRRFLQSHRFTYMSMSESRLSVPVETKA
eukprot:TRINITY_DN45433_c0_g1_i1.p1 TRINITY_DN45433_c0_g1~~TRINITY_DN45433_c0_g1_i1.p1  ORF type:complete len:472 (-),score=98.53 TRINITY_DN45433_c0_g1_i1:61-1383(-)